MAHPLAPAFARWFQEGAGREPGPSSRSPVIVAYGMGVDSTAMLVELVEAGFPVDQVLTADTGSEKPETYAYRDLFAEWLARRGIAFEMVRYEPVNFKHFPPYRTLDENCFTNGTLPSISFGRSTCSQKWKIAPQNRWTEAWAPARAIWAADGKVIKLIGYDASPADSKRYAHAEGYQDPRYVYGYPLRELGWTRDDCKLRIMASGLPVPPKSACFMCGAAKTFEIDSLPVGQLRRIVLMEARAAPRLRNIEGLWRNGTKGTRGGDAKPGRMTDYIRRRGLLPVDEIDAIVRMAPAALVRWQDAASSLPPEKRPQLRDWMALFEARGVGMFDDPGAETFFEAA